MRLLTVFTLACSLLVAGCGDDEPEPEPAAARRPAPQRPIADTASLDTAATDTAALAAGEAAGAGAGAQRASGRAAGAESAPDGERPEASGGTLPVRLYTVQVGAFMEPETARLWQRRLEGQGLPVWVAMAELEGETFYRLRVGAVSSVSDARRLGGLIGQRYEWPVWVAPVTPADQLPDGAVESTRRVLSGD